LYKNILLVEDWIPSVVIVMLIERWRRRRRRRINSWRGRRSEWI